MKKTHTTSTHTRTSTGTEATGPQVRYRPSRSAAAESAHAAVQSAHVETGYRRAIIRIMRRERLNLTLVS